MSAADYAPYRELESDSRYASQFGSRAITYVDEGSGLWFDNVHDVDMDQASVIRSSRQSAIGTRGVASCIAIGARGSTATGASLLGLSHYSGIESAEQVMSRLHSRMLQAGAFSVSYHLVGGMVAPAGSDPGSLGMERALLALSDRYSIQSARLHVSEGDEDGDGPKNNVNVVMTDDDIYFSRDDLYE